MHDIIVFTYPVMVVLFLLSWLVSPGHIAKPKSEEALMNTLVVHENEAYRLCPDCVVIEMSL